MAIIMNVVLTEAAKQVLFDTSADVLGRKRALIDQEAQATSAQELVDLEARITSLDAVMRILFEVRYPWISHR